MSKLISIGPCLFLLSFFVAPPLYAVTTDSAQGKTINIQRFINVEIAEDELQIRMLLSERWSLGKKQRAISSFLDGGRESGVVDPFTRQPGNLARGGQLAPRINAGLKNRLDFLTGLLGGNFKKLKPAVKPDTIVLMHANIIDGLSDQPITDATVVIQDGKIIQISQEDIIAPDHALVIDLMGRYLLPGLIDAHVHIRTFDAAKRALESGVTTVRSMGVSHFTDVGLRKLALSGNIDSPEILAAGYHLRPEPADEFFMDFPELAGLKASKVTGEEALRQMAKSMVDRKVDWLKVNATARAGLPNTDPREPYYNEAEIRVLVQEGAKAGIPVAAHAHGDKGGRAAVLAGVKSIEHGTYLSEPTLSLMVEKGTFLVPTIAVVNDLAIPGGDYDQPLLQIRGRHMLPRVRETAAMAHRMGVKIIAATDTGYASGSTLRLGQELEELVGIGMSPLEAIQAATTESAKMLGIHERTGSVRVGLEADLLIVENNPLESIGVIHDPLLVINNGKIILNRLQW